MIRLRCFAAILADFLDGAMEKADAVSHAADRRAALRARAEDFMATTSLFSTCSDGAVD